MGSFLRVKYTRTYPRLVVDLPVQILLSETSLRERATSLGGGGMFLAVTTPLELGTEVEIRFRPARHLPVIPVKAKVLYQIPEQGTAVEFTEIQPEHRQALVRLILYRRSHVRKVPRARMVTQVICPELLTLAYSRDISVGGMFIETHQSLPVDTRMNLRFHLEDDSPIVTAEAVVAYEVVGLGIGVRFWWISLEDRQRVADYVERSQVQEQPIGQAP
jgi:c-di-GMP-binding flagellar brake protein YcgR